MVASLPAAKFVFLGVRQLTRPISRRIVKRATTARGPTYRVCIGLGRVSLGFTGVIAQWSREEDARIEREKQKQKEDAEAAAKVAAEAVVKEAGGAVNDATPTPTPTSSVPTSPPSSTPIMKATPDIVMPRSRSLMASITYGPIAREGSSYDPNIFLSPTHAAGEVARVLIIHPTLSAWTVFKKTFLAPLPEKQLVDAGADLLVEVLAISILAAILAYELTLQARANAKKEAHLLARIDAIEDKVNELARRTQKMNRAYYSRVFKQEDEPEVMELNAARDATPIHIDELPDFPELELNGRFSFVKKAARWSYKQLGDLITSATAVATSSAPAEAAAAAAAGTNAKSA